MNTKNIVIGVLAVTTLLFGYLYLSSGFTLFGTTVNPTGPQHFQMEAFLQGLALGTSNQSSFSNTGALTVGSAGSQVSSLIFGKCNPTQTTVGSQAATTTAQFYCAVTGVKAGDKVFGDMPVGAANNPNGSSSSVGGFVMVSAYATSTGVIAFQIANFTGAATSSFAQATTSVEYFDFR